MSTLDSAAENTPRECLQLKNIHKRFQAASGDEADSTEVLRGLSLSVREGEFLALFGPNGCGKTTLLNLIAGLETCDAGEVRVRGKTPADAKVGYVFQSYRDTLLPWRRVIDNISFGLEIAGVRKAERRKAVADFLEELDLDLPLYRYPYQLSGGQQQLLCILRSFLVRPDILLMDEPFSALDYQTRKSMQDILRRLWQRRPVTTIYVSHEIRESILLADRLALLTPRPAAILHTLEVDLPMPRTTEWNEETESRLHDIESKALRIFNKGLRA